jgi:phosphopantetheinyl transferase
MPICYKIDSEDFILGLWNLTESETQLLDTFRLIAPKTEIVNAGNFKNPSRKSEWIAVRLLLYELLNEVREINYDENRKPSISESYWDISISHTKGLVAVILSKKMAGIDIEAISERVLKIEDKFLSEPEKQQLSKENRLESSLICWSAKETIYKIYGKKALDFKKDMCIKPFIPAQAGQISAQLNGTKKQESLTLNYFIFKLQHLNKDYIVVYHYA